MAPRTDKDQQPAPIDLRVYVGIMFFRWQLIVVCFLYALLAGVLYLRFTPKKYQAVCQLMVYRDPKLTIPGEQGRWSSIDSHSYILKSQKIRERVRDRLTPEWGEAMGSPKRMWAEVLAHKTRSLGMTLQVVTRSADADYSGAFLTALLEEHESEWQSMQMEASDAAGTLLVEELARLEEKIRSAEDDLIEYQRLHDIARVEARGAAESGYLKSLISRRIGLTTELLILDALYPEVKDENVAVLSAVNRLTRETGAIGMEQEASGEEGNGGLRPRLPAELSSAEEAPASEEEVGWQNLRVRLLRLQQSERDLAANLLPEHPRLKAVRGEIAAVEAQLQVAAQTQLADLRDRRKALTIQLNAIEGAEYKWQAKDLMASQRNAELKRIASVVKRFENNYNTLYSRLHNMRVAEELESEHFRLVEPVRVHKRAVWPDAQKILLASLAFGLGAGLGLAFLMQFMDNKIQSIKDVELQLGIPFLGGIPYWANSDLEKVIRPIVTEERSSGAIEAYRALRTNVLAALDKINEKILLVTSADSREGKTLTALNLGIMIAQMEKRVLLVDMDIRRGRLHRSLSLDKEPGITDVLEEGRSMRDVIVPTRVDNLFLAPAGRTVDNAAELLQASDVRAFFVEVQDDYDYILVDTSPVLRVTDTVILATQDVGAVLYVARVNHTAKPLISYSLDMLTGSRVLGMIMNSIVMHKISSLYYAYQYPNYAYYSNAYAYGYDYYYGDGSGKTGRRIQRGRHRIRELARKIGRKLMPID